MDIRRALGENVNKLLVATGLVVLFTGFGIAAYGFLITIPQTGVTTGVFIGVAVGLLGLFIVYLGHKWLPEGGWI